MREDSDPHQPRRNTGLPPIVGSGRGSHPHQPRSSAMRGAGRSGVGMFTGSRLGCGIQSVSATRRRFGWSRSMVISGSRSTGAWSTSGWSTWRCGVSSRHPARDRRGDPRAGETRLRSSTLPLRHRLPGHEGAHRFEQLVDGERLRQVLDMWWHVRDGGLPDVQNRQATVTACG